MPNLVPLVIAAGAAVVLFGKKKKRRKKAAEAPPGPDIPPFPGEEEPDEGEPPAPGEAPGEPELTPGTDEPLEPGKAVASGIERHRTGAYPWKIIFTQEGDYAAHSYPMGHRGPHEEVAREATIEGAISAFQSWAENEDRRKRNLSPLITGTKVGEPQRATPQDQDDDIGGLGGG